MRLHLILWASTAHASHILLMSQVSRWTWFCESVHSDFPSNHHAFELTSIVLSQAKDAELLSSSSTLPHLRNNTNAGSKWKCLLMFIVSFCWVLLREALGLQGVLQRCLRKLFESIDWPPRWQSVLWGVGFSPWKSQCSSLDPQHFRCSRSVPLRHRIENIEVYWVVY